MLTVMKKLTSLASSKKGAKWTLAIWVLASVLLGGFAPSAKEFATSINATGLPSDAKSLIAEKKVYEYFPDEKGTPAILVFNKKTALTQEEMKIIDGVSKKIEDEKIAAVKKVVPLYKMPPVAKTSFVSENKTTVLLPVSLKDNLEREVINETIKDLEKLGKDELKAADAVSLKITGPAGIVSDMISIFSNADIVLLLGTVGLIFVLLILIYRSPILSIVPLIAAGIVYEVVNKTIGLFGEGGMGIESQSLSIMSILLFAALTDYALLILSRFREELRKEENKYVAMKRCMEEVTEPIFFSGSTVLASMLVLFAAIYEPYRNFAPVFSIAMVLILLGGLTLLPALFVLLGRKSFWPIIPKVGSAAKGSATIWEKLAKNVVKRPIVGALIVFIPLLLLALNTLNVQYSFNLIKSFPDDIQSRQGYHILEDNFSPGDLAPATVIVEGKDQLESSDIKKLREELLDHEGVASVTPELSAQNGPMQNTWLSEDGTEAKLTLTFKGSPYEKAALNELSQLREDSGKIVEDAGLEGAKLYYSGETAKQLDTREANSRDTWVLVTLITILITVLLFIQTKSYIAPLYMILTIIFSYFTALGTGSLIFDKIFGFEEISYRIPLYSFIFLVALGVDYNIMLISRIKEEARRYPIKKAIEEGLAHTGGVISSAGLILAATFGVLVTQPIMELYMFGATVAIGVLIDTFLIRTVLVPAIMVKLGKYSLWPLKVQEEKSCQ
ncbi:MMPL family transporter [Mesobacillus zeae]|uniref:MMPL family transporter n=1 Tax=Mesobacillus zeae TaxID=1917180 RepID=A0A398BBF5_9BACI|nr:MMPL family transporter [Mesobacillus zeae]RID87499.1 MMPL family transporter [Mesobacillus zeae]